MRVLFVQRQLGFLGILLTMSLACEHALEPPRAPALDFDDVLLLEDTFTKAVQLYQAGSLSDFDSAAEKFKLVLENDTLNCFESAYFYLANIYLTEDSSEQARKILILGKQRYSELGGGSCTSDIVQRFDWYLEQVLTDSLSWPPSVDSSMTIFVAYDEPPSPIGGLAAIQRNLEYPQDAITVGAEGRVVVQSLVDCFGHVCETRVLKSGRLLSMDLAARRAVKSVRWQPALQRDRPVRVWVAVPVVFRLN